ncbi:pyrroloquinoline quinone biosynthesis peptide chaperone PqqD [Streptomyces longispororuber]|uniref:pyrroloquinoline quinone biosynthesis peptide chaperone PqqD n=1 Tax=Streptomyces longispororuber TaxID=68230 RepID=UPI00210F220A|nr:pyrroloquinoline quinone biosynthesis peptide chaperone PqqD [Streptomyces longispororuber]MCQ4206631.1 pyrroloquinoline quinone biosynthesis peptide chaperone PqqD [Streptomyces longispororuber]
MTGLPEPTVPRLRPGVRLTSDPARGELALLPERVVVLNDTAAAVLAHCDGTASVTRIVERLGQDYDGVRTEDVCELLLRLAERRVVDLDG